MSSVNTPVVPQQHVWGYTVRQVPVVFPDGRRGMTHRHRWDFRPDTPLALRGGCVHSVPPAPPGVVREKYKVEHYPSGRTDLSFTDVEPPVDLGPLPKATADSVRALKGLAADIRNALKAAAEYGRAIDALGDHDPAVREVIAPAKQAIAELARVSCENAFAELAALAAHWNPSTKG
jgi:hypothetical protein